MDTTVSKKWDVRIKSVLLLLLSLFLTQVILSNSFIAETPYLTRVSSFSYFFSGFHQFTENRYSPFLFVVSYYLISQKSNDIIVQSLCFGIPAILSTILLASNSEVLNPYFINTLLFFSLVLISFENLFSRKLKITESRFLFMFLAGILHGSLFANSIMNIDLPNKMDFSSILIFSGGILVGLLSILAVLTILVGLFAAKKDYYKKWILNPVAVIIGLYSFAQIAELLLSKN